MIWSKTETGKAWHRSWCAANRDKKNASGRRHYAENKDKYAARNRAWRENNWCAAALLRAKHNAKRRGLDFDLTAADISKPAVCPVLGTTLDYTEGPRTDAKASLDRMDSAKGYVRGNVITVSWRANRLKSNATVEELLLLARYYDFWS